MAEKLTSVIFSFWFIQVVFQTLNWTYWIQTKEYRFDRFKTLFFSSSGRKDLHAFLILIKLLFFLLVLLNPAFGWFVLAILILMVFVYLGDVLLNGLRRPVFTERTQRILATCAVVSFLGYLMGNKLDLFSSLFFAEVSLIVGLFIGVYLTQIISDKIKKEEILKAQKILKEINPVVIGVTGSYGKSTTKDFIAHFLGQIYKVAKTQKNENTEFGVARSIIGQVDSNTKYFVAEMGAYKLGEIRKICDIVSPQIGILTGIEPQHLELFGSLENIKKAKFELIESLPEKGTAIFNLSNPYCRELYEKAKNGKTNLKVLGYFVSDYDNSVKGDIVSDIVSNGIDGVEFEVSFQKERKRLFAPVHGTHFIENLTGAILIAKLLGISWKSIEKACGVIEQPDKTMQITKLASGVILIDDSYNSNPKGFSSAISYLSNFKKRKKIVVMPGIIELGSESNKIHKELGKVLGENVDKIFLTNAEFKEAMVEGLGENNHKLSVVDSKNALEREIDSLEKDFVILVEGRVSQNIYECVLQM